MCARASFLGSVVSLMTLEQADIRKSGVLRVHSSQSPADALVQTAVAMAAAANLRPERIDDLSPCSFLSEHANSRMTAFFHGVLMSSQIALERHADPAFRSIHLGLCVNVGIGARARSQQRAQRCPWLPPR